MDTFWAKAACKAMYPFPGFAGRLASRIRPDLPTQVAEDAIKHSWTSYSGTVSHLILAAQPPPDLRTLSVPLWLITGAEDEVVDLDHLKELARNEHVNLEVWPGGHDLPLTDAARSVERIQTLVRSER
jgi:pimeloyl-ACP methyl ester carboxylesterase